MAWYVDDRNLTSHTNEEAIIKEIYTKIIIKHYNLLIDTRNKIKNVINNEE